MLISRDEKINASAVWGPPEAWGPRARAHRAHWIRRHWPLAKLAEIVKAKILGQGQDLRGPIVKNS